MSEPVKSRGMSGKDVITVGIFSAIYFVINFAFMLLGGLHPLLWILMPGFIALFTGIPYLMMCAKVQKVGSGTHHGPHLLCHRAIHRCDPGVLRSGLRLG